MRRLILFAGILVLVIRPIPRASAQDLAPAVPPSEACTGDAQRSLLPLFATPVAGAATGEATPTAIAAGTPADEATVQGVSQTVRGIIACLNSGDSFTILTLVSDDYLRREFSGAGATDPVSSELEPFVNAMRGCQTCQVQPRPEEERIAVVVGDVASIDEATAVAVVEIMTADLGTGTFQGILIKVGDRWVVDRIITLHPGTERTPEATPVSA